MHACMHAYLRRCVHNCVHTDIHTNLHSCREEQNAGSFSPHVTISWLPIGCHSNFQTSCTMLRRAESSRPGFRFQGSRLKVSGYSLGPMDQGRDDSFSKGFPPSHNLLSDFPCYELPEDYVLVQLDGRVQRPPRAVRLTSKRRTTLKLQ